MEVLAFLMHWKISQKRSRKQSSFVLQWCLMVRDLLMCLQKRYFYRCLVADSCTSSNYIKSMLLQLFILLQLGSAERFMQESEFLIYGNGKDEPPTGFMFEKQLMKGLYFNQSPTKVLLQPYRSRTSYQ